MKASILNTNNLFLELSTVLWEMTLKIWFYYTGAVAVVGLVFGFSLWFVLTCAYVYISITPKERYQKVSH